MSETATKWMNKVDPSSISKAAADAYKAQTEAYKVYRAAQARFEAIVRDTLKAPEGKEIRFNYRFGLSIGLGDKGAEKATAKATESLADWLKRSAA